LGVRQQSHDLGRHWTLVVLLVALVVTAGIIFGVTHGRNSVSTSNSTANLTPEQQFVKEAIAQIPQIARGHEDGIITVKDLETEADFICNDFASYGYEGWVKSLEETARNGTSLQAPAAETFIELAIDNICPSEASSIPYGYPGAP
jgi:hypothetical protein